MSTIDCIIVGAAVVLSLVVGFGALWGVHQAITNLKLAHARYLREQQEVRNITLEESALTHLQLMLQGKMLEGKWQKWALDTMRERGELPTYIPTDIPWAQSAILWIETARSLRQNELRRLRENADLHLALAA
ncbi:MAG TPA: hypothetical protein VFT59_00375 [Candidatus Saccharimonadales bacterium]|nr:hypothetical protein [Candidatus Saccharimonadales bacterium]